MIPKIKFAFAGINETFNIIWHFINSKNRGPGKEDILRRYPLLKERMQNSKEENKKKIVRDFFSKFEEKNKHIFEEVVKDFQKEWNNVNEKIMVALEAIHEIKWAKKHKEFLARVTSNPICPRYLEKNTFDIYFAVNNQMMIKLILHELSHFIFFEKWKEIFPNTDKKEFELPHLLWKFSEIAPYAILSDEKIQEIFKHEPLVYGYWHKIEINKKPLTEIIKEIYQNRNNFEDFIRKSWKLIQDNKQALEN